MRVSSLFVTHRIDGFFSLTRLEETLSTIFPSVPNVFFTVRQKEFSSRELYAKRTALISTIPNFWSEILTSGAVPAVFGATLTPLDAVILRYVTSINVERYQIKSDTEGEPRSLRFTFEFATNRFFSDAKVVKDFEYRTDDNGPGGYVSKPVNFKWTKEAKKQGMNKLLDLAEELYQAEQAYVSGVIEQNEREGLWQYEKLRGELEKQENEESSEDSRSFLEWFGYRGAVNSLAKPSKPTNGNANGDSKDDEDDEEEEEEDDGMLDVDIFPAGEDVAVAIAEDLWPNAMDYFIQATTGDIEQGSDYEDEDEDEEAPELVDTAEFDGFEDDEAADPRPAKKRKTSKS